MQSEAPELRPALLLPLLFDRLQSNTDEDQLAGPPLTVLDVGPGVSETVHFLSRFRCRVHFASLFDVPSLEAGAGEDDDEEERLADALAEALDFAQGCRFDICLLWDYLNYLPAAGLRAFSGALRPHIHEGTRAHGFGAFSATATSMKEGPAVLSHRYAVHDADRIVARPLTAHRRGYRHSPAALMDALTCFAIERGTLLRGGNMEFVFRARAVL